jgi:hypothetical protein
MNNAVLIQQCWRGDVGGLGDYEPLMELTNYRNQIYCQRWEFDYVYHVGTVDPKYAEVRKGGWVKIELILKAMAQGYEWIVWLDPDTLIRDTETNLRNGCPLGIGATWMRIQQPEGRFDHWNVGALYIRNYPPTQKFMAEWLATYPGDPRWMEQGEFNKLGMKSGVVQTISDRWNATMNYSMVPDAVVLGFHGNGNAATRLEMMTETLKHISPAQEAEINAAVMA